MTDDMYTLVKTFMLHIRVTLWNPRASAPLWCWSPNSSGVLRRSISLLCAPWYYESMLSLSGNQNGASLSKLRVRDRHAILPYPSANSELGVHTMLLMLCARTYMRLLSSRSGKLDIPSAKSGLESYTRRTFHINWSISRWLPIQGTLPSFIFLLS